MVSYEEIGSPGSLGGYTPVSRSQLKKLKVPDLRCPYCASEGSIYFDWLHSMSVRYTNYKVRFPRDLYFVTLCCTCKRYVSFPYVVDFIRKRGLEVSIFAVFKQHDYRLCMDDIWRVQGFNRTSVFITSRHVGGVLEAIDFSNCSFTVRAPSSYARGEVLADYRHECVPFRDWQVSGIKVVLKTSNGFEMAYEEENPYNYWKTGHFPQREWGRINVIPV